MACNDDHDQESFDGASPAFRRALWAVIAINGAMFLIEFFGGYLARSSALQADALDFLGDTFTYGLSLAVIGQALALRAKVALFKGLSLAAMGLWVVGSTAYAVLILEQPRAELMGAIGVLALAANLLSVFLLMRFRDGDANVRSVWLCSRNDAIGNFAVLLAAGLVFLSGSAWPDLVVAFLMASLFLQSAVKIILQAREELQHAG